MASLAPKEPIRHGGDDVEQKGSLPQEWRDLLAWMIALVAGVVAAGVLWILAAVGRDFGASPDCVLWLRIVGVVIGALAAFGVLRGWAHGRMP